MAREARAPRRGAPIVVGVPRATKVRAGAPRRVRSLRNRKSSSGFSVSQRYAISIRPMGNCGGHAPGDRALRADRESDSVTPSHRDSPVARHDRLGLEVPAFPTSRPGRVRWPRRAGNVGSTGMDALELKKRRVRCLKIVEHTYWNGSISLSKLADAVSELPCIQRAECDVVLADIVLLRRQGFPIELCQGRRCSIRGAIPGFSLRLTRAQASVLLACCASYRDADTPRVREASGSVMTDAIQSLEEGLRRFHPGSERIPVARAGGRMAESSDDSTIDSGASLSREARLVHRCLCVLDTVERRDVRTVDQLATALNLSDRTLHNDLGMLREAGFDIIYDRRRREYHAFGLTQYLSHTLTAPAAAALLEFFKGQTDTTSNRTHPLHGAVSKLVESIRLVFSDDEAEPRAALARDRPPNESAS